MAKKRPKKRKPGPAESSKPSPATGTSKHASARLEAETAAEPAVSDGETESREDSHERSARASEATERDMSEARAADTETRSGVIEARDPGDRFDTGGLIVVGVIFGLIGLAIAVEFWLH